MRLDRMDAVRVALADAGRLCGHAAPGDDRPGLADPGPCGHDAAADPATVETGRCSGVSGGRCR